MEVPIIKVLGCGQTVQKAHMSAVRMGPAEPESLAGGCEFFFDSTAQTQEEAIWVLNDKLYLASSYG